MGVMETAGDSPQLPPDADLLSLLDEVAGLKSVTFGGNCYSVENETIVSQWVSLASLA